MPQTRLSSKLKVERIVKQNSIKERENCFICDNYLGPFRNALNSTLDDSDKTISEVVGEFTLKLLKNLI